MEKMRINKYFSSIGYCSRRKADQLLAEGRVTVDGQPAEMGMAVDDSAVICVDGQPVTGKTESTAPEWYAFHKPVGVVCSENGQGAVTIEEYLHLEKHLIYVGRLDKDSEGLLLLTNRGDEAQAIARSRNEHEKEYEVTINRPVSDHFLEQMMQGVPILDTVTKPCKAWRTGKYTFHIVLTQGLNRQIRRMCEACGVKVSRLRRLRVMNIQLGSLPVGAVRPLTEEEINNLTKEL